jgi:hypothetical protein
MRNRIGRPARGRTSRWWIGAAAVGLVVAACGSATTGSATTGSGPGPVWTTATNGGDAVVVVRLVGHAGSADLAVPPHSTVRLTATAAVGTVTRLAIFDPTCEVTYVYSFAGDPHPFGDGGVHVGDEIGVGGEKGTPTDEAQPTAQCAKAAVPTD